MSFSKNKNILPCITTSENDGDSYKEIQEKNKGLKINDNKDNKQNKMFKKIFSACKFVVIFFLLMNFPQIKGQGSDNPVPDWMKLLQIKHKHIHYPSIARINKQKGSQENYFVLAYQKRHSSRFKVFSSYQIFLTFFKKDLSIFNNINSVKIDSPQIPLDKDQIEPKVVSFKFSSEGSQPNNYVVIWKSKTNCPSMKFQAARFTYGDNKPNKIKYLTKCGPKYGEIQSALNYDVITTHSDRLFLVWHQKNGENDKDYDIYFKIFDKELKEIKGMTNIYAASDTQTNLRPQIYPNLLFSKGYIVVVYQDGNAKNNHGLSNKYNNSNILLRAYDDNGNLKLNTFNITPDYDSSISPKIHYINDSNYFDNDENGKFLISFLKNDDERGPNAKYQLKQKKFELKIENEKLKLIDTEERDHQIIEDIINFPMKNLARNCGPRFNDFQCAVRADENVFNNDHSRHDKMFAIDGKNDRCDFHYFHTNLNHGWKWWKVAFREKKKIKKIRFQTRLRDCVERLNGLMAKTGMEECNI